MPGTKSKVYEGSFPYVFVSCAHADRDVVVPIIRALADEGYRVWYDDGVQKGSKYPDYIARHVLGCSCFVALLSELSKRSEWCGQEVYYALNLTKPMLPIYLDEAEPEPGLLMRLTTMQAMYWYRHGTDVEFLGDLFAVKMLDCCLAEESRLRRGVRARGGGAKARQPSQNQVESEVVYAIESGSKPRVEPKTEPKSVLGAEIVGSSVQGVGIGRRGANHLPFLVRQGDSGACSGGHAVMHACGIVANGNGGAPGVARKKAG